MDDADKEILVARLRTYLDTVDDIPTVGNTALGEGPDTEAPGTDLYTVLVEVAGLRTEVRTEARLVKEALDQTREVVVPLRDGYGMLQRALHQSEKALQEQERRLLKPLLLGVLDVRDRLAAGLAAVPVTTAAPPSAPKNRWWRWRWRREPLAPPVDGGTAFRDGLEMTLRRLDAVLAEHSVEAIVVLGRSFDPRLAMAVATHCDPDRSDGEVITELRAGFHWHDQILRTAEVVVNRHDGKANTA